MNDNKSEVILIATKTIYTTRAGAIKMALVSIFLVGSMQLVIFDPSGYRNPGLFVAIGYIGSFFFSLGAVLGLYRIFKPSVIARISKEGISFSANTFGWDEIGSVRLVKSLNRWASKKDIIAVTLKSNHKKYTTMTHVRKKTFDTLYVTQGYHMTIQTYMGSVDVNKLCAELNGYLKKYSFSDNLAGI